MKYSDGAEARWKAVAELKRLIATDQVDRQELRRRLTVEDLEVLSREEGPDLEVTLATYQRVAALLHANHRDPTPISDLGPEQSEQPLVVAPHGTVAHEVKRIRLLLVDFNHADSIRLRIMLDRAQDSVFEVTRADRVDEARGLMEEVEFDVGLVNLTSQKNDGLVTLARAEVVASDIPIIALIARSDEPQLLHLGTRDYLVKEQMNSLLLVRTLRHAIEQHELTAELDLARKREHFHATRDSLTGLPNRFYFEEQLGRALAFASRNEGQVAVFFLDLDRFKHINDTLGHDVGDSLIITMADRLSSIIRSCDLVARIGGDEFMLMIQSRLGDDVPISMGRKVLDILDRPFRVDGRENSMTGSLGIAIFPSDGETPETLIRKADAAMYQAKANGRNNYQIYNRALNATIERKLQLESRLRGAQSRGHLAVHYQARVDVSSGQIIGAEALARWNDPELGPIAPSEFIPIAEDSGVITSIGEWVLKTACAEYGRWQAAGHMELRLSVNFSARQLRDDSVLEVIARVLKETGFDPSNLELELTESTLIEHEEVAARVLRELSETGIGIALDDFGTGFSSLNYLRHFPVDTIKIDQSFVRDLLTDADDAAITEAIISIAEKLGLRVVAEGVESVGQSEFLLERNCFEMQGYLFSRPLNAEDFRLLLETGIQFKPEEDSLASARPRYAPL